MRFIKMSINLHRILEFAFRNITVRIERAERNLPKDALRSEGNMIATLLAPRALHATCIFFGHQVLILF